MITLRTRAAASVCAVALLCLVACRARPTPFTSLDEGLQPLRAAFNAEVDRTRVIMLVAPT